MGGAHSGARLSSLSASSHPVLIIAHDPHFTDEEMRAETVCNLPKGASLPKGRTETPAEGSQVLLALPLAVCGHSRWTVRPFSAGKCVFTSPAKHGYMAKPTSEVSPGFHAVEVEFFLLTSFL